MPTRIRKSDLTAETYLTSHEVGKLIQMNPSTVNKWVKEERIPAFTTPGGHRRIQVADLVAFLREYKMPLPKNLIDISPSVEIPATMYVSVNGNDNRRRPRSAKKK